MGVAQDEAAPMPGLIFTGHASAAMRADQIPEAGVYHVVRDADEVTGRADGRAEYVGAWQGRTFVVIVEDDGRTVVTV